MLSSTISTTTTSEFKDGRTQFANTKTDRKF